MKPDLRSVKAIDIKDKSTEVELVYYGSELLAGIDLHGVGAGLSWLKNKGRPLNKQEGEERSLPFIGVFDLEDRCEFRARAYIVDEDYWESGNHVLTRSEDGSIILETDEQTLENIEFVSAPPNPYSPYITSIKLKEVKDNLSIFSVDYCTKKGVTGIELHGVDGGLSWLKGESIEMQLDNGSDTNFTIDIEIINTVEFKARAYNDRGDHWEEGENHKIHRRLDGTLAIIDDFTSDEEFEFVWILPLETTPTPEEAIERILKTEETPTSLFQYLIYVSVWFDNYYQNPMDQDLFDLISRMMRYVRSKQREIGSYRLDKFVNPIFKALYDIYTSAISFLEEDTEILKDNWEQKRYVELFAGILENVTVLSSTALDSVEDREKRKRELWEYN